MLPVCRPADASGDTKIFVLASITGLTEWVDYIPIQEASLLAVSANRYDALGYQTTNNLASDTGLVAFKDYIPVYIVTGRTTPWNTGPTGYIPVYNVTGSFSAQPASFDNISFLMDFEDGTNTLQDALDLSNREATLTWTGGTVSTTQAKFGTKSFNAGNTGQIYRISIPDHASVTFGTGDFTLECNVYFTKIPSATTTDIQTIMSKYQNTGPIREWNWTVEADDEMGFAYSTDGTNTAATRKTTGAVFVVDTWHHIAVTRESNVLRMFVDGEMLYENDEGSVDYFDGALPVWMGAMNWSGFFRPLDGFIDNPRIIKGEAIYVADFTPPSTPHPTS